MWSTCSLCWYKNVREILPFGTQGDSQPLAQGKWYYSPVTEIYCLVASVLCQACWVQRLARRGPHGGPRCPCHLVVQKDSSLVSSRCRRGRGKVLYRAEKCDFLKSKLFHARLNHFQNEHIEA